jgi:3-oxoacyl-[acyl-carrier protein] reductase
MTRLDGQTVIVTGASRGLGREMALRFSEEGARVTLVARDEEALTAVAETAPSETLVAPADVTDSGRVEEVVGETIAAFGGVDTLVNNAGIGLLSLDDGGAPVAEIPEARWRQIIDVNLTSIFLCSKAVLPHMAAQGRGNVVNISSGFGRRPAPGFAPYVASKYGLEGLTGTTALDYRDAGVNVNALDPGGRVDTAFWDHLPDEERASILRPDVMNEAAVLLAAQGPDGVTGESLPAKKWEKRLG